MSLAATKRQLRAILGGSMLGVLVKAKGEINRSNLITLLAQNESIVSSLQALYGSVAESCPAELNAYAKHDPALGDVWHVIHNWSTSDDNKKGAVTNFLQTLFRTKPWKLLTVSGRKNEHNIRSRFHMNIPQPFSEAKPERGGQSYYGQPTPSDTKIRHETEKKGDVLIPSNLSKEQAKGDLEPSVHPDALMDNQSLPIVVSIQDKMTDIASSIPDFRLNTNTQVKAAPVTHDQHLMKSQPTQASSGYRETVGAPQSIGVVQSRDQKELPLVATVPPRQSKEEMMIQAADQNDHPLIPGSEVTSFGQQQLNLSAYTNSGQGTGGKTTMGAPPSVDPGTVRYNNQTTSTSEGPTSVNPYEIKRTSAFHEAYGDLFRPEKAAHTQKGAPSPRVIYPRNPLPFEEFKETMEKDSDWATFLTLGKVTWRWVAAQFKKAGFMTDLSPEAFELPAPKDSSPESRIKWLYEMYQKGTNLGLIGVDVAAFMTNPTAFAVNYIASTANDIAGSSPEVAQWSQDTLGFFNPASALQQGQAVRNLAQGAVNRMQGGSTTTPSKAPASSTPVSTTKKSTPEAPTSAFSWYDWFSATTPSSSTEPPTTTKPPTTTEPPTKPPTTASTTNQPPPASTATTNRPPVVSHRPVPTKPAGPPPPPEQGPTAVTHEFEGISDPWVASENDTPLAYSLDFFPNKIKEQLKFTPFLGLQLARLYYWYQNQAWYYYQQMELGPPQDFLKWAKYVYTKASLNEAHNYAEMSRDTNDNFNNQARKDAINLLKNPKEAANFLKTRVPENFAYWTLKLKNYKEEDLTPESINKRFPGEVPAPAIKNPAGRRLLRNPQPQIDLAQAPGGGSGTMTTTMETPQTVKGDLKDLNLGLYDVLADMDAASLVNNDAVFMAMGTLMADMEPGLRNQFKQHPETFQAFVESEISGLNSQLGTDAEISSTWVNDLKDILDNPNGELALKYRSKVRAAAESKDPETQGWLQWALSYVSPKLSSDYPTPPPTPSSGSSLTSTESNRKAFPTQPYQPAGQRENPYATRPIGNAFPTRPWQPQGSVSQSGGQSSASARPQSVYNPSNPYQPVAQSGPFNLPIPSPTQSQAPGTRAPDPTVGTGSPSPSDPPGGGGGGGGGGGNPSDPLQGRGFGGQRRGNQYVGQGYTTPVDIPDGYGSGTGTGNIPKSYFEQKYGQQQFSGDSTTYTPYLRLFLNEGDANEVTRVNDSKDAKQINRMMWQSFNNYAWEANEEKDNPLHLLNIIDETRRFYAPLDKDELMEGQGEAAIQETYDNCKECYSVPEQSLLDGDAMILDTRGDGNLTLLSPDETEMIFHDVYLPPWIEIPEDSPWKQFTPIEGTQLPDSMMEDTSRFASNDNPALRFQNAFISSTLA